jgi:micrococcal nuclease
VTHAPSPPQPAPPPKGQTRAACGSLTQPWSTQRQYTGRKVAIVGLLLLGGVACGPGEAELVEPAALEAINPAADQQPATTPEPTTEPKPEPEPHSDVSAALSAELENICEHALNAHDPAAARLRLRDATAQLAPDTDFTAAEITAAANRLCADDIVALGRQAQPETEPRTEADSETEAAPADDLWLVTNVVDGDTIDVRNASGTQERVRVIGIDTPEHGECGFGPATSVLQQLILGQQVRLTPGARDDRDRYDRILRYIDIGDLDAGLYLIEQGLAIARYDSRDGYGHHPRQDAYVAADNRTEHTCGVTFESATSASISPGPPSSSSRPTLDTSTSNGVVKMSNSGICHAPDTRYYDRTTNFAPYDSIDDCLAAGGRLPQQ